MVYQAVGDRITFQKSCVKQTQPLGKLIADLRAKAKRVDNRAGKITNEENWP